METHESDETRESEETRETPPPAPPPVAERPTLAQEVITPKNPWVAGLLSLFPGIGNIYNGLYLRGITFFLLIFLAIYLAGHENGFFGFAVAFLWIFNVVDAFRQANLINSGYARDLGEDGTARRKASGREKLAAGVALVAIGALGMAEIYFHVHVDRIFDHWPLILFGLGLWLLWSAFQSQRKSREADGVDGY